VKIPSSLVREKSYGTDAQGSRAIITGSGRGIGRAVALLFAREGARVVISDIDPQPAQEAAQEIKKAGGECMVFPGDVTQPDFAEAE